MKSIAGFVLAFAFVLCSQGVAQTGVWISPGEIASLPTSGTAWSNLKSTADQSCGTVDLSNQDQSNNVCILAKALVFARTGVSSYRSDTIAAIQSIVNMGTYSGRALALGRELGTYVVAADLINLKSYNPSLDGQFRTKIKSLLTTHTDSGPASIIACSEERPNNWGMHCGATRAAVDAYLGDLQDLARVAQIFKGWLGDRSSYAGFTWGDLSWQCDSSRPVGINPTGCTKSGHLIDGVLPDDQRRSGGFTWPAPQENYVYEALQGALMQAVILQRAGYPAFAWENRALMRAYQWLYNEDNFAAGGDDTWEPFLINYFYGTSVPTKCPTTAGKNMGWTDWTHSGHTATTGGDTAPPVISSVVASLVSSTQATIMWSTGEASDSQVDYGKTTSYGSSSALNSTKVTSHSVVVGGLTAGTVYHYRVKSRDAAGNLALSGDATFTTVAGAGGGTATSSCVSVSTAWQNTAFGAKTGTFTAQFDATPSAANIDGVMGLSASSSSSYASLAAIVRFYTNGRIEARNGGAYTAGTSIAYTPGAKYHFRLVVRVSSHTYDVYVTPPGSTEKAVGTNYAFRTESAGVTQLANRASYAAAGTVQVCNFVIN